MTILLAIALGLVNAFWALLVVFGLPGTWLMAATTAAVAWWQWDASRGWNQQFIGLPVLVAVVALAALGEVLEFVAGVAGASRAGASRWGSCGALAGGLVGGIAGTALIPLPIVGALLGACGGAAVGAWFAELAAGRRFSEANAIGIGAGVGRLKGTLAKLAIALAMWIAIVVAAFWP